MPQKSVCPHCRIDLQKRVGAHGWFMGCPNYPNCSVTQSVNQTTFEPQGAPGDVETRAMRAQLQERIHTLAQAAKPLYAQKLKRRYRSALYHYLAAEMPWNFRTRGEECLAQNFTREECTRALELLAGKTTLDLLDWENRRNAQLRRSGISKSSLPSIAALTRGRTVTEFNRDSR